MTETQRGETNRFYAHNICVTRRLTGVSKGILKILPLRLGKGGPIAPIDRLLVLFQSRHLLKTRDEIEKPA